MKPDGGTDEAAMEAAEVDPSEFFVELGMLILESRLPTPSVKGRQDGPHCPPAVGDRTSHVCDASQPLCKRALEMRRQMQALWRNRIPMCIEVLLLPDCSHGQQRAASTDAAPPVAGDGCILLEQWTIQFVVRKPMESCISSKALFQAMRSYLHFSQLSAWLNLTHGNEPRHVGYRVSPPAEFCTTTFQESPESHLFPLASANKSTNMKVTLAHLPRLPGIPKPSCSERTGKQSCHSTNYVLPCRPKSPVGRRGPTPALRSDSPKLAKPNVLNVLSAEEREMLTRPSRCSCAECVGVVVRDAGAGVAGGPPPPRLVPSPPAGSSRQKSPEMCLETARPGGRDAGAVPKRFSLQLKSTPEDLLAKHPRSPQHSKSIPMADGGTVDPARSEGRPRSALPACLDRRRKDLIPEVLPTSLRDSSTDSNGSTPDYDHFLSKTLMQQSEPLSLQEMEEYLQRLYQPAHDSFRGAVVSGRDVRPIAAVKLWSETPDFEGEYDFPESLSGCLPREDEPLGRRKVPSSLDRGTALKDLNIDPKSSEIVARLRVDLKSLPEYPVSKSTNPEKRIGVRKTTRTFDDSMENCDGLGPLPKPVERKRPVASASSNSDSVDFRPVFTLGDAGEGEENCETIQKGFCDVEVTPRACVIAKGVCDVGTSPVAKFKDEEEKGGRDESVGVRSLHKSVSCPSKPTLRSSCGGSATSRVNSLLKTVMKKEMVGLQSSSANEVRSPATTSPCVPTDQERIYFRRCVQKSTSMVFHATTGLPLQSSPVPAKKISCGSFDYDSTLNSVRAIKNSLSCINLDAQSDGPDMERIRQTYSTSAPASTNCLLGNFEESLINGRIEPSGVVSGFTVDIGASGSFCPQHITLPVTAFFFSLSDDNAPSPYLGHINLEGYSKRGYHIPKQGTIQVTLFNPNTTVVKMFVVKYNMSDMPPSHQTVLRQRTLYMPVKGSPSDVPGVTVYLRYLIHLRFASSKSNKIYLHTDIRVIFARDKFELDSRVANYELRSFTEGPENPRFSPRR